MQDQELPGYDLISAGMEDMRRGEESVESLLVSIGAPRLRRMGMAIPESVFASPELRLYQILAQANPDGAHSRYNALIRRLVSYERARECAK